MLLELPARSACLVELAPRDPRDLLERKELLERKARKVQLVATASKARLVCLVLPDPRVPQGRTVTRERLESLVRREAKQTKENRVPLVQPVFRVPSALRVLLGAMESPARGASRGCLDRRETKAPEASLDPRGPSVCRVFPDPRVRRERMETSARWAPLVRLAPEVPRVLVEQMAHKVLPVV